MLLKKSILSGCLLIASLFLFAQKPFEGKVLYDIKLQDLPEEAKQYEAMFPKELTMFITPTKVRTEMSSMMGPQITISDSKTKVAYVLIDMMGQKKAIKSTAQDAEKANSEIKADVKETAETKEIAGYTCKKSVISYSGKEGANQTIDVFYTQEIGNEDLNWDKGQMSGIKGFPLEYTMYMNGIKMKMTAKLVSKETIDASKFELPSGYQVTTVEEMQKMMGGK